MPEIDIVPAGSLPKTEFHARRVRDEREGPVGTESNGVRAGDVDQTDEF